MVVFHRAVCTKSYLNINVLQILIKILFTYIYIIKALS